MAVCLVGTRWGLFLGQELRTFYQGPLVVCGRDAERVRRVAQLLDAQPASFDWESIPNHPEIESLIVAVPPQLHRDVALAGLRAGKHVFVEKPLATTLEDCDAMIEAAQASGVVLAAGENIPFRPALIEAKRRLSQIGEPRLLYTSALHSATQLDHLGTGILLDFAVHHIRAVRELFGEPDTVFATSAAPSGPATGSLDNATLVLASRAGWQAVLALSWQASAGAQPEFLCTGTHGALKIWPDSTTLDFYPLEPTWRTRAISRISPHWLQVRFLSPETQRYRTRLPHADRMGYRAQLRSFMAATARALPDVASAREARRDVEIVMAAYASLATGAPVECSPAPVPAPLASPRR